jgi:hypothetical protein
MKFKIQLQRIKYLDRKIERYEGMDKIIKFDNKQTYEIQNNKNDLYILKVPIRGCKE